MPITPTPNPVPCVEACGIVVAGASVCAKDGRAEAMSSVAARKVRLMIRCMVLSLGLRRAHRTVTTLAKSIPVPRQRGKRASARRFRSARRASQQRGELAALVQLAHDVAAADQLAVQIELGIRRPARVLLEPLTQLLVRQDVVRAERHLELLEDAHHGGGEAA